MADSKSNMAKDQIVKRLDPLVKDLVAKFGKDCLIGGIREYLDANGYSLLDIIDLKDTLGPEELLVPKKPSQQKMAVTVEANPDKPTGASEKTSDEFQRAARMDQANRNARAFLTKSEDPEFRKKILEYYEDPVTGVFSINLGRKVRYARQEP
jgi:hypothetical protein